MSQPPPRHSAEEIALLRAAAQVAASTLEIIGKRLGPGTTGRDIDNWVRADTAAHGATPSQLGYHGFPASVCVSPNAVVCHGIPTRNVILDHGDIVNVDVTSCLDGFHGDTSKTFMIGKPSAAARKVVRVARQALAVGMAAVAPGKRVGDIGAAIETLARKHGCGVVREYGGHGIGRDMHMPPNIAHIGPAGRGARLEPGMTFTIEPMITLGWPRLKHLDDGWTVMTADGSPSAQFEHTVLVTESGCEALTVVPRGPNLP